MTLSYNRFLVDNMILLDNIMSGDNIMLSDNMLSDGNKIFSFFFLKTVLTVLF
jgi:hypothetical protein